MPRSRGDSSQAPEASWASTAAARNTMRANRGRDTAPELLVRSLLHRQGYRFRVDAAPSPELRRRADIVFRRARVAVFIDGCYWHGCPDHGSMPKTNRTYWENKLGRNVARDRETNSHLRAQGWLVMRFWEHEDPQSVVDHIAGAVEGRKQDQSR